MTNGVVVDVTTLIGAEEYLVSQNRRARPEDPFARQCFVEMIQTLVFVEDVYVAHPVRVDASANDFGVRPHLLQELISARLLQPLHLDQTAWAAAQAAEADALSDLNSRFGTQTVLQFIEQALTCDRSQPSEMFSLSARLHKWAEFQRRNVRLVGHHHARIRTADGVEEDDFGSWARAAAVMLKGALDAVAPPGEGLYLMATLARGLKYKVRAEAAGLCYEPHPMRRDFSLTFDLNQGAATDNVVFEVIKAVRGIRDSLAEVVGPAESYRLQMMELELPLIGGRLWSASEVGRLSDERWIDSVVANIAEYRAQAADLRRVIDACVTDEDYVRLARDLEDVRNRLLRELGGLRDSEPSHVELELVDSVASVTQAATGIPIVRGLYFGTKHIGRGMSRRLRDQPFQQFLYKEFRRAWRLAGR